MPVSAGKSETLPCNLCGGSVFKPALNCEGFSFVRCASCGLVQRNPQLLKEEIISRYTSDYGKDYLAYELSNETSFLKLQQLALKDAGFKKIEKELFSRGGAYRVSCSDVSLNDASCDASYAELKHCEADKPSILDIGCATGALLVYLRGSGWRVTGVEISPSADYAVKERSLDVRNLPLEENNFPGDSFDVILASHLIEHLNNPKAFLSETYRVLKNNGNIFITTPNISGFQARLFGSRWRSAIFDHLFLFSKSTLFKMMKNAGFKIEGCRTWGGLAAGAAPLWLKKPADILAKPFGFGDVMIVRAKKIEAVPKL